MLTPALFTLCHGWHLPLTQFRTQTILTPQGWQKGYSSVAPSHPNCSLLSLPADVLKDVIQEYDEYFPEIIERASYALEKVKGYPLGDGHNGELLNGTKVYASLCREPQRLINPAPSPCR